MSNTFGNAITTRASISLFCVYQMEFTESNIFVIMSLNETFKTISAGVLFSIVYSFLTHWTRISLSRGV